MGFNYFMVQWNIAVAIPVNVSLCLLYMWHNYITVVLLHWYYDTHSASFLDIRIYQLVSKYMRWWSLFMMYVCHLYLENFSFPILNFSAVLTVRSQMVKLFCLFLFMIVYWLSIWCGDLLSYVLLVLYFVKLCYNVKQVGPLH